MFKFFQRKEEEKQASLIRGLSYGLGGALLILLIILLVVFGGQLKERFNNSGDNNNNSSADAAAPKLRITVITSRACEGKCFDINLFLEALRQNNINETGLETLYLEDAQGRELVDRYNITKVPTVLIAGELDKDQQLAQAWPALGEVIDGVFVFRQLIPPYLEVASGAVRGEFSLVYLTNESCGECYDVKLHDLALNNLGLDTKNSSVVDINSDTGREFVDKYDITMVPTILLSGDLGEYQGLQQIWSLVGRVTDDGTYIFTGLEEMGNYYDLTTKKVVEVKLEPAPETTQ